MNANRRKQITAIIGRLEELDNLKAGIQEDIENLRDEEQEYFDNMPEGLQAGDKGDAAANAVSQMENAISELENCDVATVMSELEAARGE